MSNPWSTVMPGGVEFSRPADTDEDEDWGFGAPGDPVPYQPDSTGEVSTSVDTDRPGDAPGSAPSGAGTRPAPSLPVAVPVRTLPVKPSLATTPVAALPVVPPTPAPVDTPVPVPSPAEAPATDETPDPVPAKRGLHRLPSSPRGPRPSWMNNPVFTTDTDDTGVGEGTTTTEPTTEPTVTVTPGGVVSDTTPTPAPSPVATPSPEPTPVAADPAPQADPIEVVDGHRVDTTTGELLDTTPTAPVPLPVPVEELVADADWDEEELAAAEAEEAAAKAARKETISRVNRPFAVTSRDIAILEFLGRYRLATYAQIAGAFNTSQSALRHRLPRLAKEGLIVRKTVGNSAHGVWLPTDSGMKLARLDLPTPSLSWGTVAHTLGLVDIGIRFEALGETVVTEREIRSADTRDKPSDRMRSAMGYAGIDPTLPKADDEERAGLYVVRLGGGESTYGHIPDMVLARPPAADGTPQSAAIELELNHKPAAQWRKVLTGYKKANNIGAVVYFTHSAKVRNGIIAAAKEVGAQKIVMVRKFEPSDGSAIPQPKD